VNAFISDLSLVSLKPYCILLHAEVLYIMDKIWEAERCYND